MLTGFLLKLKAKAAGIVPAHARDCAGLRTDSAEIQAAAVMAQSVIPHFDNLLSVVL
jgi:hypothetical protein